MEWAFDDCYAQDGSILDAWVMNMTISSDGRTNGGGEPATERSASVQEKVEAACQSAQKALDCQAFLVSLAAKGELSITEKMRHVSVGYGLEPHLVVSIISVPPAQSENERRRREE